MKTRWRAWKAIEGLWALEDPKTVDVRATEQDIQVDLGGVPFRGIVDRLGEEGDGLIVTSDGHAVVPNITIPEDAHRALLRFGFGHRFGLNRLGLTCFLDRRGNDRIARQHLDRDHRLAAQRIMVEAQPAEQHQISCENRACGDP